MKRLKNGLAYDGVLLTRYDKVTPKSRKAYSEIARPVKMPINARNIAAFVTYEDPAGFVSVFCSSISNSPSHLTEVIY